MARLPTVEDVARVAGVSRQTVSNVLNSPSIVAPTTRSRVQAAVSELGYRPHASARRLRTRKSSTIGVRLEPVSDGISGSVLDGFLHALTEQADRRQMRVLLYTAQDSSEEIAQIQRLRDGADVDAFVLTSTAYGDPRTQWLIDAEVPFATFGRPWGVDDMDDPAHLWVDVDGRAGVRAATTHLIERGSRRTAYIGWPSPSGAGDDRRRGWSDALAAAGQDGRDLAAATTDGVGQGGDAARALLARDPGIDAIVCASDSLALGAMIAASTVGRAGVRIVGFDDTPVAAAVGLSSVVQPLAAVASAALELLFGPDGSDVIDRTREHGPRHRLIAPHLVEREPTFSAPEAATRPQHNRTETQ